MTLSHRIVAAVCALVLIPFSLIAQPIVIAHRGASGYLPEHTLEAAAYAHALGADYIEQDVVLSKDNVLVVLHDIHLEMTTDVATRFPERKRTDGRYYAIDFTWPELATLRVHERVDAKTGQPVFPARFPHNGGAFRLCQLDEQLTLIAGLNRSTGRDVGVYVEFKEPAFHTAEGRDLGAAVLTTLKQHGFTARSQKVFVQCFDPTALKRLRTELGSDLKLVLLTATDPIYAPFVSAEGLRAVAAWADGIGPSLAQVLRRAQSGGIELTSLVADAHAAGLVVHPYTFRADALPAGLDRLDPLFDLTLREARIDGFFIDQPDLGVRAVASRR